MFPGFFLSLLYLVYVIGWVLINPKIAPALPPDQMRAPVSPWVQHLSASYSRRMLPALLAAVAAPGKALRAQAQGVAISWGMLVRGLAMALVPLLLAVVTLGTVWWYVVIYSQKADAPVATAPAAQQSIAATPAAASSPPAAAGGLQEPPAEASASNGLQEPPAEASASSGLQEPPDSAPAAAAAAPADGSESLKRLDEPQAETEHVAVPPAFYTGFAITCAITLLLLGWYYWKFDGEQFEILRMLTSSVMPLAILTFVVLAVILFGITTATESAAVGAAGAFLMAWQARTLNWQRTKEAVFLTAKTTSMVCWLFIGSAIFSAVFAILGGQSLVERWVLSMNLSPIQFLLVSQAIIFVLGWPLEWTEIIVIFVPIFLPLLQHFQIDPMLWGVLVFVNLQAAFLSPPVAMSAFYLKGVSPPHVTLNQIFAGMMPYMLIVILCMVFMYIWPGMTLWLPNYLYGGG